MCNKIITRLLARTRICTEYPKWVCPFSTLPERHSRSRVTSALAALGFFCFPVMCSAQMVGPTPQPPGIPVTAEEAGQVQVENRAIHGQGTLTWLLQPAFGSPYQGPQSLSP